MVIGDDEYYFEGEGELTVIPSNYLHTTNSDPGNISYWEYLFVDVEQMLNKMVPGSPRYVEQMLHQVNQRAIFTNRGKAPELTESIENIIEIMRRGEPFYQEEAEGEMLAFLSKIARENGNIQGGRKRKYGVRKPRSAIWSPDPSIISVIITGSRSRSVILPSVFT